MAKNSKKQILRDERRILKELTKNANKSINEIAKTCSFSRQKVWRIIKNLEKTNTIWGYTAIIDAEKQEKKGFIVLIKRTNAPMSKEIVEKIVRRDITKKSKSQEIEIVSSIYTNGPYDYLICFNAPTLKDAKRFVESLHKTFEGHIAEAQLLEELFPVEKCGITNPEVGKLKDFFDF
jgi:DNA-binding Lrp family transcriptional regulator